MIDGGFKMITEDYVSIETAKLLKEKGFDGKCSCYYFFKDKEQFEESLSHWNWNDGYTFRYSAPTLQMAMKWLEEKYGVFCVIRRHSNKNDGFTYSWNCEGKMGLSVGNGGGFKTAAGAREAAIKYCLDLI